MKPNPISSGLGIWLTAWPTWQLMALYPKTQAQASPRFKNGSLRLPAIRSSLPGLEGISPKAVRPRHSSLPSWPAEVSQSQGGDHLLREADWGLVARKQGPGLLHHRQIHPGQQGRWKKAHKEVGDRPRRARLPCPGHPPLGHFGQSTNGVRAWSHPHLLRWFPVPVRPPEGKHAGLCPHQPPLYAFKVWTQWGCPSGNRLHLCKENGDLHARGVGAYKPHEVHSKGHCHICLNYHDKATPRPPRDGIAPAQWRVKGESLYMPMEHAAYLAKPDYKATKRDLTPSAAPRRDDPLTRHQLPKRQRGQRQNRASDRALPYQKPPRLHPDPSPGKEMRARGVQAQTYHSFFRWSGQMDWTPERMGQKFVPCVIIWDEVCTVPRPTLETFLDWLKGRGVQVICCGDQGQPPPIAGEMLHDWLHGHVPYYKEVEVDHSQRPPSQGPQEANPPSAQQGPVLRGTKGTSWLPRVEALRGGLEAMWSHLDLEAEGSRPGPEAAVRAPWEVFPGRPRTSAVPPKDTRRQNIMALAG